MRLLAIAALGLAATTAVLYAQPAADDWPTYGRDSNAHHYSPLDQITPCERRADGLGIDGHENLPEPRGPCACCGVS